MSEPKATRTERVEITHDVTSPQAPWGSLCGVPQLEVAHKIAETRARDGTVWDVWEVKRTTIVETRLLRRVESGNEL